MEIGTSWADQMEEGEAMYERDSGRPAQKVGGGGGGADRQERSRLRRGGAGGEMESKGQCIWRSSRKMEEQHEQKEKQE